MGRKQLKRELLVAMNGRTVGSLVRTASGALTFRYTEKWLEAKDPTPISLSLPLSPDQYSGAVVSNFFENLLPDNEDIRRRMQTVLSTDTTQPFDLLAAAGSDCIGAIQLFTSPNMPDVHHVDATPISDSDIARMLRDYRRYPLGMAPQEDDFRISIAGAQEKTALLWYRNAWRRPHRTTPTTHVFKLPIGLIERNGIDLRESVENEWLCLKIAAAFGLPVPNAEIRKFENITVLVVERFDRQWSDDGGWLIRLPQEDICQSLGVPPGRKYQSDGGPGIAEIMDLLLQSEEPDDDRRTFFRANVVYWLLAAIDGHAKNFSIFLLPGGRCKLTPLYDIMSAYPLVERRQLELQKIKMAMAVEGKNRHYRWHEIQRRHWITTAKNCHFPTRQADAILDDCASRIAPVVEGIRLHLPTDFPKQIAEPILDALMAGQRKLDTSPSGGLNADISLTAGSRTPDPQVRRRIKPQK